MSEPFSVDEVPCELMMNGILVRSLHIRPVKDSTAISRSSSRIRK